MIRGALATPFAASLFGLRIAQLVLAIITLGLLAYLGYLWTLVFSEYTTVESGAIGVGLFTVCLTIIFGTWYLISTLRFHSIYHVFAVIALDTAGVLFWLVSWALIAQSTADFHHLDQIIASNPSAYGGSASGGSGDGGGGGIYVPACPSGDFDDCYPSILKRSSASGTSIWTQVFAAALAMALIEWFLFIASLALVLLGFRRQRKQQPNVIEHEKSVNSTTAPQESVQQHQMQAQSYTQPAQRAQPYPEV